MISNDTKPDFENLFAAESKHFWFRYRNDLIGKNISKLLHKNINPRILELGCGNGNVLREIEKRLPSSTIIGSELYEEGLANARHRVNCELRQADIYNLPDWEPFDLIGLFDVLEHLPDAVKALKEIRKILKPGGKLIITVPASMKLWSYVDEVAGHFKRYTCQTLKTPLLEAGFKIHQNEPFMMPLFPAMWISRNLTHLKKSLGLTGNKEARTLANEEFKISPLMNFAFGSLLSLEGKFLDLGLKMPFGTSILAIAENPDKAPISLSLAG